MAQKVLLQHPQTKKIKSGFVGFSWTTLFFQLFVPLFRGDWKLFLGILLFSSLLYFPTANMFLMSTSNGIQNSLAMESVASSVWYTLQGIWSTFLSIGGAFFYNKIYTKGLIKKGWRPMTELDEQILIRHKIFIPSDYEIHTVSRVE